VIVPYYVLEKNRFLVLFGKMVQQVIDIELKQIVKVLLVIGLVMVELGVVLEFNVYLLIILVVMMKLALDVLFLFILTLD
jgi:hypothetical protein